MAARRLPSRILGVSVCTAIAAGSVYSFLVYQKIKNIETKKISVAETIPEHFRQSWSVKDHRDVSDEVLLARFVNGFFGGLVIGPERLVLQTARMNLVHFTKTGHAQKQIWSAKEIPEMGLPRLHTALFGVFQVTDRSLDVKHPGKDGQAMHSYVDFSFGSDTARFAGVHRFSIVHPAEQEESDGKRIVQIRQESACCNPISTEPLKPEIMYTFHMAYAQLLFREGVSEIVRWLEESR
ncbi:unnamed protein product [Parascedosporium putredinis]|uniref:Uncharacterized protein n=1 Tax=Parascedosporium putredinis TaxID=1442378 RepID=A0A9P1M8V4_9PEZI|nr:unnamed protein product [Parascedosporium putredinis]CAI7989629.1 unnamed protein product [Parascedosporium putredinis]